MDEEDAMEDLCEQLEYSFVDLPELVSHEELDHTDGAWQMPTPSNHAQQPVPASNAAHQHSVSNVQQWLRFSQHMNQRIEGSPSAMAADPDPDQAQQRWQHAQEAAAHLSSPSPADSRAQCEHQAQHALHLLDAQHAHHLQHTQHHAHALEAHHAQHAQHVQQPQQMEVIQGLSQHLQAVQQRIVELQQSSVREQYQHQSMGHFPSTDEAAQRQSAELRALEQIRDQVQDALSTASESPQWSE